MKTQLSDFVEGSTHFAYSKRGLYNRDVQKWSKWKQETYTNDEMSILAHRYTKQGLSWFRSTVGRDHTLFVLDFDIKMELADQIIKSRLDQANKIKDKKKRYHEKRAIEKFRFDTHEYAIQNFLRYAFDKYPELKDFSWKFSGGVGRRHAIQRTHIYKNPLGFEPVFEYIAMDRLGMEEIPEDEDERGWQYFGDITYQSIFMQYKITLDLSMKDPKRLIRGVYSPHFKDKIYRYSIPIPDDQIFDIEYIRDNCYQLNGIVDYKIKPFAYDHLYNPNITETTPREKKFTIKEGKRTQHISLDMSKIPPISHIGIVQVLDVIATLPCMNIRSDKSHAARTRFGNISTQKFTPEQVTAYFRDNINDDNHNNQLHLAYYHLQRLKPFGIKNFKYWNCYTFQNQKNNFAVPKKYCKSCPIQTKYRGQQKQSPFWVFTLLNGPFLKVKDQQQGRGVLRERMKMDMHHLLSDKIQFNEVQAAVRAGKTKTMINVLANRTKTLHTPENVFFVGNIAGTKENIHAEAMDSGFDGRVIEWGAKSNLCPIKRENPNFIVTSGFCSQCPRKKNTKDIINMEDFEWLYEHRWGVVQSPDKKHWIENTLVEEDECCTYYAMKHLISTLLHDRNEHVLLIADPRFIMQRDLIVTAEPKTYDWIRLFDKIIYDESHNLINIAYESLVKNITTIVNGETVDELINIIDPDELIIRDSKGLAALKHLQGFLRLRAANLHVNQSSEIIEVNEGEDAEILNHSTGSIQKYISQISSIGMLDSQMGTAIRQLLDIINLHDWIIINHSGDNWFDLFIHGHGDKMYYNKKDVLATSFSLYLKSRMFDQDVDYYSVSEITFPLLPLHHAKKVVFMSATPNTIANEILYFPTRKYVYYPKNQARLIFNYGTSLTKSKVNKMAGEIITLTNAITTLSKSKVLLVTDNKKRLETVIKNKNIKVESYHPRDSQHAEGTTLRGFKSSIAINVSFQNIISIENMAHIMAEIWDYEIDTIKQMFHDTSVAKVIQAIARTMPYEDDDESVTYILLDERFVYSAGKIFEWLSPVNPPTVSIDKFTGIPFQNLVELMFKGEKQTDIIKQIKRLKKGVKTSSIKF